MIAWSQISFEVERKIIFAITFFVVQTYVD